jgi:uncharacterized membrane protein
MVDLRKVRAAGISWYRREDYPRILEIMEDAHVLPDTFDDWRKKAGGQESEWKSRGVVIVRAIIDPDTFPAWCRKEGLNVDAKARTAFASEFAMLQVKQTH